MDEVYQLVALLHQRLGRGGPAVQEYKVESYGLGIVLLRVRPELGREDPQQRPANPPAFAVGLVDVCVRGYMTQRRGDARGRGKRGRVGGDIDGCRRRDVGQEHREVRG